jgi:hypothetical protein
LFVLAFSFLIASPLKLKILSLNGPLTEKETLGRTALR